MRIAVISDIHANLTALRRVLDDIASVDVDEIWCLGDIVGIGPRPAECVALIRERCTLTLAGNHDLVCTGPTPQLTGPFGAPLQLARYTLPAEDFRWLASLSPIAKRHGIVCAHGSPRRPADEFTTRDVARVLLRDPAAPQLSVVGHTHQPEVFRARVNRDKVIVKNFEPRHGERIRLADYRAIVNPGAVGRPQGDHDPTAAWALLDLHARRAHFRRLEYPVEYETGLMHRTGLGGPYADALYGPPPRLDLRRAAPACP